MQSGGIPDEHISSSSYFDASVNAIYGRLLTEAGGGAWCPRDMVYKEGKEYLEVNLGALHVVTKVEVQGRFGNGQGREFARQYKLQVWRPGLTHWVTYMDGRGEELLEGNSNTYLAQTSQLSPPVIATRVRFLPYSDHPRTVCMRVELYGCQYSDGLVSYSMPDGDLRGGDTALSDLTYDGLKRGGWLEGGLGQLTDGETGHTNFRVDALGMGRGYEWVGWKNTSRQGQPVPLTFQFDSLRNFSAVHVYVNNLFTKETMMFSRARITFSVGGEHFPAYTAVEYRHNADRIFEHARNVTIKLHGAVGRYVRVELFFALKWLMVSEVSFDSVPCRCNLTEEEEAAEAATTAETVSDERLVEGRAPVVPAEQQSSAFLLGGLIFLALVFGMVPLVLGVAYYHRRAARKGGKKSPPPSEGGEARKVSMKMKDLHINVNLSPVSNGYAKAKGRLYGHVAVDEEASAMYQEPFKAPPMHNPGYYTLGHSASSDTPLKCALPDTDDSVDYAVPDVNMTPPPPFSEVYTPPPPPVPLTKPPATLPTARSLREAALTAAPVPALPPPPDQEYYAAPLLCQPTNIQGAAGTVAYAVADHAALGPEPTLPEVCRAQLRVVDTLGEGVFGLVQLCEARDAAPAGPRKVVLRTLKLGADEETKKTFRQETQTLARLDSPNVARVVAASHAGEPPCALLEYPEHGDLCQFLQRHKVEEAGGPSTCVGVLDPRALSYGALVYMVTQIASGMQYLEAAGVVHRDLAARNCLVGRGLTVKISDLAMSRALYSADYYRLNEGRTLLPVRWMAWESILQGRFSSKSDVWAFGVTLWEILTLARQQPFAELSDEGVLENASHCLHGDGAGMMTLPQPPLCPREIYDMMAACWRPADRQRPPFWEIVMFLQRKNLGYTFDYAN
ncbi:hypothetical protein O3P69_005498 [Scylla paramamosain]